MNWHDFIDSSKLRSVYFYLLIIPFAASLLRTIPKILHIELGLNGLIAISFLSAMAIVAGLIMIIIFSRSKLLRVYAIILASLILYLAFNITNASNMPMRTAVFYINTFYLLLPLAYALLLGNVIHLRLTEAAPRDNR